MIVVLMVSPSSVKVVFTSPLALKPLSVGDHVKLDTSLPSSSVPVPSAFRVRIQSSSTLSDSPASVIPDAFQVPLLFCILVLASYLATPSCPPYAARPRSRHGDDRRQRVRDLRRPRARCQSPSRRRLPFEAGSAPTSCRFRPCWAEPPHPSYRSRPKASWARPRGTYGRTRKARWARPRWAPGPGGALYSMPSSSKPSAWATIEPGVETLVVGWHARNLTVLTMRSPLSLTPPTHESGILKFTL